MPRGRGNATAQKASEQKRIVEPEKPVEPEEQVDFDEDNEPDEEIEYEEVEEMEEVEEEIEEEEEEEEEIEEVEDRVEDADINAEMKNEEEDEDSEKHAELTSLPPHGAEVYIGGISPDVSEDDLKEFCEHVGEVSEVRVMKSKDSNENKGYAFITFRTKELAIKAIEELNGKELKERKIKCSASQVKHRLFIGNVPRNWVEDDLHKVVAKIGPGVSSVELLKDPQNSNRNRGFAFIEYYNHACAEYSRQKMSNPKFKLDNNAPTVSWADPKSTDSSAASQVKAVYIKNMPKNVTQDQLKQLFGHHGEITRIVLPPAKSGQEKRYGFVHFSERSSAMKALKNTEKYEIDGQILDCSLAKPHTEKKSDSISNVQKPSLLPSYPPHAGYGIMGGAYGVPPYGTAGFAQPMIYGRGPTPTGMTMMPMLLPDGRVGYVLQQPGMPMSSPPPPQQRSNSGRNSTSSGGRQSDSGDKRRYRPY